MRKKVNFQRTTYLQELNTIRNQIYYIKLWLDRYNAIENLPDITPQTFKEWAKDPVAYFEKQVETLKEKQSNGLTINDSSFREMFNLYFEPPAQNFYEVDYFKLDKDGEIIPIREAFERLKESFTHYTDEPVLIEKLEAIENHIKAYNDLCDWLNIPKHTRNQFKELYWNESENQFDAIVFSKL